MSVIDKRPYIKEVLGSLENADLKTLKSLIDGGEGATLFRSFINSSYRITAADKGVNRVNLETKEKLYKGYLVYNNYHCTFIFNFDNQLLGMLDIKGSSYSKVEEYLDINELRSELNSFLVDEGEEVNVQVEDIESGNEPAGKVITSDGEGGAEWAAGADTIKDADIAGGSLATVIGFDSDGDLVKGSIPEGATVDGDFSIDSENAVQNKVITAALVKEEYDSSNTYNTGEIVLYDGGIYRCKEDGVTGSWDSSKWETFNYGENAKDVDDKLEEKANTIDLENGTTVVGHAEEADSLTTKTGKLDATPFAFEPSGGQTDIETGYQKTLKLVGCNLVENQLVKNPDFISDSDWIRSNPDYGTLSISGGVVTWTCTAQPTAFYQTGILGSSNYMSIPYNHKVLAIARVRASVAHTVAIYGMISGENTYYYADAVAANTWTTIIGFISDRPTSDVIITRAKICYSGNMSDIPVGATLECDYCYFTDITQLLGSNDVVNAVIGNDTSTQVAKLLQFLGGKLPTTYNTGSFSATKSKYVKSVGRNQWDEEWEVGGLNTSTGANDNTVSNRIRSKNYIRCLPNTTYYFKGTFAGGVIFYDKNKNFISTSYPENGTRTTPLDCYYIRFGLGSVYGTTYNHDITISIYYPGESGYDQYYPYEEHIDELPNIQLNGILKVDANGNVYANGDELYPDGVGNARRYGVVDLGTLEWTLHTSYGSNSYFGSNQLTDILRTTINVICTKYQCLGNYGAVGFGNTNNDKVLATINNTDIEIAIRDSAYTDAETFKTAMSGVYLNYELATPTELTANTFNPNLYADDFGTLQFLDEDSNEIAGLQGNEIFYKANIAGFAESLYIRTEGEPSDVVIQEDLEPFSAKDTQLLNAIGGTLRQLLASSQSIDFANTDILNLGSLDYAVQSSIQGLWTTTSTITNIKASTSDSNASKVLSTLYKTLSANDVYVRNVGIAIHDSYIWIYDNSVSTNVELKNKLKNVLLAYEKASE